MRATFLDPLSPEDLSFYQGLSSTVQLSAPQTNDEAELLSLLAGTQVIVSRRLNVHKAHMSAAGHDLRFIQLASSRTYLVDLVVAQQRNVTVASMAQPGCIAVAELAFALMLSLSKKIVRGHEETRVGAYRKLGIEPKLTSESNYSFQWMNLPNLIELHGLKLGLVGFGEIASEVAHRARAFGMEVFYTKRHRLTPQVEAAESISYKELPELLAQSDFVSLHVPHTRQSTGLIDTKALASMKSNAYLINTCRGGVIDETALVTALINKSIAGAGLDVFNLEPIAHDNPLLKLDNVLLSPHIGGGSGGAREKLARGLMKNLDRVAKYQTPIGIVK